MRPKVAAAMRTLHFSFGVPLGVLLCTLLLRAPLCLGSGNVQDELKEIFTQPGSGLLLAVTRHLTLRHGDRSKCDEVNWNYRETPIRNDVRIMRYRGCDLTDHKNLPNVQISENGSLIIHKVTEQHDGQYRVDMYDHGGQLLHKVNYTVHVGVPVSVPVLNVSCLRNGSAEISCRVENGTKPNIRLSVIGGSRGNYSASSKNITAIVGSPGPWNVTCSVKNGFNQQNVTRIGATCPDPLSDISVTSSCLPDGSAVAECSVNGSDPRYSLSLDGKLFSSHSRVTLPPPVSGILSCDVINQINNLSRSINISCAVPVSDPLLDVRCLQNGSADVSCRVEEGTDLSIYLTVSTELEVYNVTSSERRVRVTVPPMSQPDFWNVSCQVKNNVSEGSSNNTYEACPAPLSAPNVTVSCHTDGSASVSCELDENREVSYNWTVNGKLRHENHSRNITFTNGELSSYPLNVSCSVYNTESNIKESKNTQILCSESCSSCWEKSLIWGFVALILTMPPLFISHWYILRGMDKKS